MHTGEAILIDPSQPVNFNLESRSLLSVVLTDKSITTIKTSIDSVSMIVYLYYLAGGGVPVSAKADKLRLALRVFCPSTRWASLSKYNLSIYLFMCSFILKQT